MSRKKTANQPDRERLAWENSLKRGSLVAYRRPFSYSAGDNVGVVLDIADKHAFYLRTLNGRVFGVSIDELAPVDPTRVYKARPCEFKKGDHVLTGDSWEPEKRSGHVSRVSYRFYYPTPSGWKILVKWDNSRAASWVDPRELRPSSVQRLLNEAAAKKESQDAP